MGFISYANGPDAGSAAPDFALVSEVLAPLEAGHFWFETRNRLILALVERHAASARSYFEIGCGTGFVLDAVARARPWSRAAACDPDPVGLGWARNRVPETVTLSLAGCESLRTPFQSSFDLVGAFDVIEHVDDEAALLETAYAMLAPGGIALVSAPQHRWLWSGADRLAGHRRRYARRELEARSREAGFLVLDTMSFNAILLPLAVLERALAPMLGRDLRSTVRRNFALPGWLNRLFAAILGMEVRAILAGLRMPFGTSRFVVLRKPE